MITPRRIFVLSTAFGAVIVPGLFQNAFCQIPNFDKIEIHAEQIAPNFYTLTGSPKVDPGHLEAAGGRIGALIGPDGILLVDAQYAPLTGKVVQAIRSISQAPIRFLVNTHEHPDHTGGNPNFVKLGALLIGREEEYAQLSQPPPPAVRAVVEKYASFTDSARLPVLTFGTGAPIKVRINGETVDLIALPPGHTSGDVMVKFEKADVLMVGDIYRNYGYPFVDPTNGGSFKGLLQALEVVMQSSDDATKIVPGHGTVVTRAEIPAYRDMILDVRSSVQKMVDDGKSLQDVLAAKLTSKFDSKVPGGFDPLPAGLGNSAVRFVSSLYKELKGGQK